MSLNGITKTQHWKNGETQRSVDYFCGQFFRSGKSVCSAHRISELSLKKIILSEIRAQAEKKITAIQNWAAIIKKYLDLQEPERAVVEELIDHIKIGERAAF